VALQQTLRAAEGGGHPACQSCPSSPKRASGAAFGVSCREHGIDWSSSGSAVSFMVVRDPANTTPAQTGKLCFVCNSLNPSDRTAQHAFALWRAAVALADRGAAAHRYLDTHYWTNAAMHGTDTRRLEQARRACTPVLREQIELLSPRVIIASGVQAATSLGDVGLLAKRWAEFRQGLASGAYRERTALGSGSEVDVYCTYHTSATGVNCEVSKLYSAATERLLEARRGRLGDTAAIDAFLTRFDPRSAEGRGMRVLLLHWLDIGEAIRCAAGFPNNGIETDGSQVGANRQE
jgi:hypothetical protein